MDQFTAGNMERFIYIQVLIFTSVETSRGGKTYTDDEFPASTSREAGDDARQYPLKCQLHFHQTTGRDITADSEDHSNRENSKSHITKVPHE